MFALVNLARHVDADPESHYAARTEFERRFGYIEQAWRPRDAPCRRASLEEMDALWNEAKAQEASHTRPNSARG